MFEDLFAGGSSLADYKPEGDGGEMSKEKIEALKAWWQQMMSRPQMQQYQRMGGGGYPLDNLWQRGRGPITRSPTEGLKSLEDTHPELAHKIAKVITFLAPKALGPASYFGKQALKSMWATEMEDRASRKVLSSLPTNRDFVDDGFAGTVPGTTPGSGIVGHDPSFGWGGQTAANPVGLSDVGSLGMLGDMQGFGGPPDATVDIGLLGPRAGTVPGTTPDFGWGGRSPSDFGSPDFGPAPDKGDDGTDPGAPDPEGPDPDGIY